MTGNQHLPPNFQENWEQAKKEAGKALQEKANELKNRHKVFLVGGHVAHHHWIGDYLTGAIIPEQQLESMRDLEMAGKMQPQHISDVYRTASLRVSELADAMQRAPTIDKPRISKHRQARQNRFRARHK